MDISLRHQLHARSVGTTAYESINGSMYGILIGRTSHGDYIRSNSKWLTFLSCEPFRSPLTVNLWNKSEALRRLPVGTTFSMGDDQLCDPETGLSISLVGSELWQCKKPTPNGISPQERCENLRSFFDSASQGDKEAQSTSIFHQIPGIQDFLAGYLDESLAKNIRGTQKDLLQGNDDSLLNRMITILGHGQGLTPFGDDFLTGLLLALNRWSHSLNYQVDLSKINATMIDAAYRRTTTLSANLIELATMGVSDERLVDAIDTIMGVELPYHQTGAQLKYWGSSSGIGVLAGFATVITSGT